MTAVAELDVTVPLGARLQNAIGAELGPDPTFTTPRLDRLPGRRASRGTHRACVTSRAGSGAAIPGLAIPGLELQELTEARSCCGSAGRCNLLHPAPARDLAERKATVVLAAGVRLVVTANPGCRMQVATTLVRMAERMPVQRAARVLDASIRNAGGMHARRNAGRSRLAGLAKHRENLFDPLAGLPEGVRHARGLPPGL